MKKLIIFCVLVAISIGTYSQQIRATKIKTVDSLQVIIDGNVEHVFTPGKHATDTSEVDVIIYNGSDISNSFATSSEGVTNGDSHDHSGGDGAQINHTTLSNIGTNSHSSIDAHISDALDPHGSILTQTYIRVNENIFSASGSITTTSTTTILDTYEQDNSMWLLAFTGSHNAYSSTFSGFNAYLIVRTWDAYGSSQEPFFIKLGEESFTSRVVISLSTDVIRLQSSQASASHPLYWILLKLR